jgi:hypothetical protein
MRTARPHRPCPPHRGGRTARLLLAGAALALLTPLLAATAAAEEPDDAGRLRAKMEEVRRLMEENETALLDISTGKDGRTRRVDVPVPPEQGADAARRLRELVEGQRARGERIPRELEELLRMIPPSPGQAGGEAREGDAEGERPQASPRKERRPASSAAGEAARTRGVDEHCARAGAPQSEPAAADRPAEEDGKPGWDAALPPEIRDALAGGRAELIPARFRGLIEKYNRRLQEEAGMRSK